MITRWEVQVVHPVTGKPKIWDRYDFGERAESVAATLRKYGFFAQVRVAEQAERHDDDVDQQLVDQHDGDGVEGQQP